MSEKNSQSLKVAIVRPYFSLSKGGAERYAVELARGLAALGHSVHVFAFAWDPLTEPGVTYHRVWMPRKPAWLRVLVFCRNLRRQLVLSDYDAVLGMTPFWPQSVFWLGDGLYGVWTRTAWPFSVVRWLMCVKRTVMAVNLWLEKRTLSGATERIIAISRLIKQQAMRYYGVPEERIHTIYPGIDTARFNLGARARWRRSVRRDLAIADDEVVLLFAANNYRRKGLAPLIRAFSRVRREGKPLRLIVAGAGAQGSFQRLARRCGVADQVLFVNFVDAIEKYYAAADLFVLPTRYDPFGSVCLEAMACGLPVITTRMAGAAELIEFGKTGYVIDSINADSMLESCVRDLADAERCAAMGALAAERAKDLSAKNLIEQVARVLERAASSQRAKESLQVIQVAPDLIVNQEYLPLLQQRRLDSVAAIMESEANQERFYNRFKQIALFNLGEATGRTVFVKRHRVQNKWYRRMKIWRDETTVPDGVKEWNNLLAFHRRGLPVVTPVAAGKRRLAGGVKESFVMTLGLLDGYRPLDEYISERYSNPPAGPLHLKEKRGLIQSVARLTRDMHWSGFNHRDFYLCHFYSKKSLDGAFELRLIDLQRADYRRWLRRRWLIKDLAQLHYSSLGLPLSDHDRLRFYARYWNGASSRRARRQWLKRILRKSRAISRHDARLQANSKSSGSPKLSLGTP